MNLHRYRPRARCRSTAATTAPQTTGTTLPASTTAATPAATLTTATATAPTTPQSSFGGCVSCLAVGLGLRLFRRR
ncbi:MAG TPA: hypothetical protein O0X38_07150 [Methanocorpusculum sp.]|nr:hypothetical protein [Methanocorpusculum sp.]